MKKKLLVCVAERVSKKSCAGEGSLEIVDQLTSMVQARKLPLEVQPIYCFGRCEEGPNIRLAPGGRFFTMVKEEKLADLLQTIEQELLE
ncbi:(2Fe-2S) ferredoxin domain-containing protein [Magnetococcales bacterium HHB-1]